MFKRTVHYWDEHTIRPHCHDPYKYARVTSVIEEVTCRACLYTMITDRDVKIVELETVLRTKLTSLYMEDAECLLQRKNTLSA